MFLTRAAGYFICISKKKKSFFSIQFVSPQKGEYQTCWELTRTTAQIRKVQKSTHSGKLFFQLKRCFFPRNCTFLSKALDRIGELSS